MSIVEDQNPLDASIEEALRQNPEYSLPPDFAASVLRRLEPTKQPIPWFEIVVLPAIAFVLLAVPVVLLYLFFSVSPHEMARFTHSFEQLNTLFHLDKLFLAVLVIAAIALLDKALIPRSTNGKRMQRLGA